MLTLTLTIGVPGSGKSTWASKTGEVVACADDHFVGADGVYRFDPALLPQAHKACQDKADGALSLGKSVVVANTNLQIAFWGPYLDMVKTRRACLRLVIFDGNPEVFFGRQIHGVPEQAWQSMWRGFVSLIGTLTGDPLPGELKGVLKGVRVVYLREGPPF